MRVFPIVALIGLAFSMGFAQADDAAPAAPKEVLKIDLLPPGPNNPRNSEADFVTLQDGRVLYIYTHFTSGAGDNSAAHLASRISSDGGKTWSEKDEVVVPNEAGENVMSVSLLRLQDGRIALFYLQKQSFKDCRPVVRFSSDEGATWSEPTKIISDEEVGYYVLNNARVLQLPDGRLLAPVARHDWKPGGGWNGAGVISCFYSDDAGKTWNHGAETQLKAEHKSVILQEPGLVLTADGKLLIFCRTNGGFQFGSYSADRGETWGEIAPLKLPAPVSPATMERLPGQEEIIVVWNDHKDVPVGARNLRTPLTIGRAVDPSGDWERLMTLEDNPHGWYCYTAMHFVDDALLLSYCAGDRRENNGLAFTRVTRVPLELLVPQGE